MSQYFHTFLLLIGRSEMKENFLHSAYEIRGVFTGTVQQDSMIKDNKVS